MEPADAMLYPLQPPQEKWLKYLKETFWGEGDETLNQMSGDKDLTMDTIIESCLILMVLLLQEMCRYLLVLIVQHQNSSRDENPFPSLPIFLSKPIFFHCLPSVIQSVTCAHTRFVGVINIRTPNGSNV